MFLLLIISIQKLNILSTQFWVFNIWKTQLYKLRISIWYACWSHRSTLLRTKRTMNSPSNSCTKCLTLKTFPLLFWHLIYPITILMYWELAIVTYHYLIFLFIISNITYHTFHFFIFLSLFHNSFFCICMALNVTDHFIRIMIIFHFKLNILFLNQSLKTRISHYD